MQKNGLQFGFGVVTSGQRKVSYEPELQALTTQGGFKVTPQVSKALGLANGDYVMFINNYDALDAAVRDHDQVIVDFCNANGLDINEPSTLDAIHKEFGAWAIAKGIKAYNEKGVVLKVSERMSSKDKEAIVAANFDEALAAALSSDDAELVNALSADGIDKDAQVKILAAAMDAPEVDKYLGSKLANASDIMGTGVVLNFTDSNIWNVLKEGLSKDEKAKIIRSFPIDLTALGHTSVHNGYEFVDVPYLPISMEYTDNEITPRGTKKEE